MSKMRINEIFYSIQGESSYAGRPCVFIRLTGCNLRCIWCDSTYSFYEGTRIPIDETMTEVRKYGCPLVEITGGEPLLQKKEVYTLMECLLTEGYEVLLETSGSLPVNRVPEGIIRIIDLKCPDSGESEQVCWEILDDLRPTDEVKFVVASQRDYEWAKGVIKRYQLPDRVTVLMGTAFGLLGPRTLAEWILEDRLPVQMQLQMHKYIWDPAMRGI